MKQMTPLIGIGPNAEQILLADLNAANNDDEAQNARQLVRDFNAIERVIREKGYPSGAKDPFELGTKWSSELKARSDPGAKFGPEELREWFDVGTKLGPTLKARGFDEITYQCLERIRKAYSSVQLTPFPMFPSERGWNFAWLNPWGSTFGAKDSKIMNWVVPVLVRDFAATGRLKLVRECAYCKKWYMASRNDQRFCPGACGEKGARSTAEGRKKRAVYMQKLRKRQKTMDEAKKRDLKKKDEAQQRKAAIWPRV